jgi:hypothetical protein
MARSASVLGTAACVLAALALCGCHRSSKAAPPVTPVTPVATPTSRTPQRSSPATAPAASPSPGSSAAAAAIGAGLLGQVTYLRAAPVPQSGRTGRVTCGYGVPVRTPPPVGTVQAAPTPVAAAQPLLSASYITYVDAKTAAARVALTVQTDGAGAVVTPAKVDGVPASVLIGSKSSELVMSDGARTIVLVASPEILTAGKAASALEAMAAIMLDFGRPAAPSSAATGPGGSAGASQAAGAPQ